MPNGGLKIDNATSVIFPLFSFAFLFRTRRMPSLYAFDAYPQDPISPLKGLESPNRANSAGVRKPPAFFIRRKPNEDWGIWNAP